MSDQRMNQYEGMFLFPQAESSDLRGVVDHVRDLLSRIGAEIIAMKKWDERRLAYPIRGHKRGLYLLVYFAAPSQAMPQLERSCNLSERLLRWMCVRADHLTREEMQAADAQQELADEIKMREQPSEQKPPQPQSEESAESTESADASTPQTQQV